MHVLLVQAPFSGWSLLVLVIYTRSYLSLHNISITVIDSAISQTVSFRITRVIHFALDLCRKDTAAEKVGHPPPQCSWCGGLFYPCCMAQCWDGHVHARLWLVAMSHHHLMHINCGQGCCAGRSLQDSSPLPVAWLLAWLVG
jgi:hypothetical protein